MARPVEDLHMELVSVEASWMCQGVEAIRHRADLDRWLDEKVEGRCSWRADFLVLVLRLVDGLAEGHHSDCEPLFLPAHHELGRN